MPASDRRVLEDAVFAVGDGFHRGADIVLKSAAVHSSELAERHLVVNPALGRHQLALQHDLSVGWNHQIDRLAFNELRRLPVETPEHLKIVDVRRKALKRSQLVEDGCTNDNCDLEILSLCSCLLSIDASAVRRAGHVKPPLVLCAEHRPVEPPVVDARIRVFRDHEVVVGVRLPVAFVMQEHWEDRHVDVIPS